MKSLIITVICIFAEGSLYAQLPAGYVYDKDFPSPAFHRSRREALRASMRQHSAAVLFTAPVRNRSNDNDYSYHPSPDFYYLTGFREPDAVLLMLKDSMTLGGVRANEALFVPPRNPSAESWTGKRAGKLGGGLPGDIDLVLETTEFDSLDVDFSSFDRLYYEIPQGLVDDKMSSVDVSDLVATFKKRAGWPPENGDARLHVLVVALREVKSDEELALLRKAIDITCDGQMEMMRMLAPGVTEYQVQAAGEYVFAKGGAESVGYPSICGGGENSVILHYESNRKTLVDGELIVLDMGAEYHGYTADVTRTLPVGGRFTEAQRRLYELVLNAQAAGIAACQPGNAFNAPHLAAVGVIRQGLLDLGIIKNGEDYRRYFFHGTSHYLGLDVHDPGSMGLLTAGNVLTVEPGIYVPDGSPCDPKWWNTGIRIEDDVLITQSGHEVLSAKAPRSSDEIEKIMKERPLFVK